MSVRHFTVILKYNPAYIFKQILCLELEIFLLKVFKLHTQL